VEKNPWESGTRNYIWLSDWVSAEWKVLSFTRSSTIRSSPIILIWFLISFRLLCVTWIHFHRHHKNLFLAFLFSFPPFFLANLKSVFSPKLNSIFQNASLFLEVLFHTLPQCFDLMTGWKRCDAMESFEKDLHHRLLDEKSRRIKLIIFKTKTFKWISHEISRTLKSELLFQ
jgi:hypothetical protein